MDSHSVEVDLVCLFLALRHRYDAIRDWTGNVLEACIFALKVNKAYPCTLTEYHELAEHLQQGVSQTCCKAMRESIPIAARLFMGWKVGNSHSAQTTTLGYTLYNTGRIRLISRIPRQVARCSPHCASGRNWPTRIRNLQTRLTISVRIWRIALSSFGFLTSVARNTSTQI